MGNYIDFALPVLPVEWALTYGTSLVFFGVLIFWHLALASRMTRGRRALVATVVTAASLGCVLVFNAIDLGSPARIQKSLGPIVPISQSLIASESLDEFLDRVEALRPKLQEMTEEEQESAATKGGST